MSSSVSKHAAISPTSQRPWLVTDTASCPLIGQWWEQLLVSLGHVFAYKGHYTCLWSPVAAWSLQALRTIWNKAIFCREDHNGQYRLTRHLVTTDHNSYSQCGCQASSGRRRGMWRGIVTGGLHQVSHVAPGVAEMSSQCSGSPISWQNEENHNCKNGTRQRSKRWPIQLLWPQFRGLILGLVSYL